MFTTRSSRPFPPKPKPAVAITINDVNKQPFRFLDLPKDIRLMVYEELRPVTTRDKIPLPSYGHHLTLFNTVIPGISMLATCRQIHSEASHFLTPIKHRIIASPPTLSIHATHLISLINLHDSIELAHNTILTEALVYCFSTSFSSSERTIQRWRNGSLTTAKLRLKLGLQHVVAADDEHSLRAIACFILRVKAYTASAPDTMYKYPPLTLVITLPDIFPAIAVTTTTSRLKALTYRLFDRDGILPRTPRTQTGLADLNWVLCRFAFGMAFVCRLWGGVAFSMRVRGRVGGRREHRVQGAVMRGVWDAGCQGSGLLYYAGKAFGGGGGLTGWMVGWVLSEMKDGGIRGERRGKSG